MEQNKRKFINKLKNTVVKLDGDGIIDQKYSKNYFASLHLFKNGMKDEFLLTSDIYPKNEDDYVIVIQFDFDFTENKELFIFTVGYRPKIDEFGFISEALENNGLERTDSRMDPDKAIYKKMADIDCDNKPIDDYINRMESLTIKFLDYLDYVKSMKE